MKNILLLLSLFISLSVFSQSEIWGVKHFGGASNGGFLYTIDSATSEIVIQHRFSFDRILQENAVTPYFLKETGEWLSANGHYLVKFNEATGSINQTQYTGQVYGSFTFISDSLLYVLDELGIMKINPMNMQSDQIKGFLPLSLNQDNGMIKFDDSHLVWQQVNENKQGYLCKFNMLTEEVTLEYDMESFEDATYNPTGKLIEYDGRYYGLTYQRKDGVKYLLIYSYNFSSKDFREEYRIASKHVNRNTVNGMVKADNGKFYSIAPISNDLDEDILFSFNPVNKTLDSLTIFSDEIGADPEGPFIYDGNIIYGQCYKGGSYSNGSIFKYDIENNNLESIYSYDSTSNQKELRSLSSSPDGKLIGFDNALTDKFNYSYFELDTDSQIRSDIIDLSFLSNNNMGQYPGYFVQLDNGNILGTTDGGGRFDLTLSYIFSLSTIYQFNPLTKEFSSFNNFELASVGAPDIYKLSDNKILVVDRSIYQSFPSKKYIYHPETNELDTLSNFPWNYYKGDIVMESDSIMFTVTTGYVGKPPVSIVKLNIFSNEIEEILKYDDRRIKNFVDYDNDFIVFLTSKDQESGPDSLFLNKLNKKTKEIITLTNLNQFSENAVNIEFLFTVTEDKSLIGNFFVEHSGNKKSAKNWLEQREVIFNMDELILHTIDEPILIPNNEIPEVVSHSYIETYSNDRCFFAINEQDTLSYDGSFRYLDIDNDQSEFIEHFESSPILGMYDLEMYRGEHLKKFRKTDFSIHWKGEKNNDWYNEENWLGGVIPDTNSIVSIDAFSPYNLVIDTTVKCSQIIIMIDAKLTLSETGMLSLSNKLINHGSFVIQGDKNNRGSIICQESMLNYGETKYSYTTDSSFVMSFASPTETPSFRESNYYQISEYSSGESSWNPISFYPFIPSANAAYLYDNEFKSIDFRGDLNYGEFQLDIPRNGSTQLYPLPNPYPSSLDWRNIELSNLNTKALYIFNPNDSTYSAFVDGLGNASPLIQPLDVFWVYGNSGDNIELDNSLRMHSKDFISDEDPNRNELILQVKDELTSSQTHISFNPNASAEFDEDYDALNFSFSANAPPYIFTFAGEKRLKINQLPDTAMMDLAVQAHKDGTYKISVDKNQGFDFVVLEDLIWKKRIDLLEEDYSFDYFTSDGDYPFKLYFTPWVLEPLEEADVQIYYYPESIVIRSKKQINNAEITFFDLAGKDVLQLSAKDFYHYEKPISLPIGHYIIQLRTGDLIVNKKVLVRR